MIHVCPFFPFEMTLQICSVIKYWDDLLTSLTRLSFVSLVIFLNEKIVSLNKRYDQLRSDDRVRRLDSALSTIKELNEKLQNYENIIKEKDFVNNELILAYGDAKKDKESIKEHYSKLQRKYNQLQEEIQLSRRSMDVINDRILELQFENNILNQRHRKSKNA